MSFEQFLQTHDVVDFVWEIFKGISPTIIALLTIWINTIIGKRKTKKEIFANEEKELQLMISNLLPCITETGEYLLEAIQNADEENSDELLNMFVIKTKYLLKEAGKCLVYIDIRAEIFKKESMKFDKTHEAIRTFSDELLDILNWYNQEAVKTPKKYFDTLCDEVQKKLIYSKERVEREIFNYCIKLDDNENA